MNSSMKVGALAVLVGALAGCGGGDGGEPSGPLTAVTSPNSNRTELVYEIAGAVRAYLTRTLSIRASGVGSDRVAYVFASAHPESSKGLLNGETLDVATWSSEATRDGLASTSITTIYFDARTLAVYSNRASSSGSTDVVGPTLSLPTTGPVGKGGERYTISHFAPGDSQIASERTVVTWLLNASDGDRAWYCETSERSSAISGLLVSISSECFELGLIGDLTGRYLHGFVNFENGVGASMTGSITAVTAAPMIDGLGRP